MYKLSKEILKTFETYVIPGGRILNEGLCEAGVVLCIHSPIHSPVQIQKCIEVTDI